MRVRACVCVCVRVQARGCACERLSMCMSACVYVCMRDCVILHFILAIFENICSNLGYYIHLSNY